MEEEEGVEETTTYAYGRRINRMESSQPAFAFRIVSQAHDGVCSDDYTRLHC